MNLYSSIAEMREVVARSGCARFDGGLVVTRPDEFRNNLLARLVWTAVFRGLDGGETRRHAIREAAESLGVLPASILPLYEARGRGEWGGITVPAIKLTRMWYDTDA